MTKKELTVILRNLRNAKDTIEELACENYPITSFHDRDLEDMFYQLNAMSILVTSKIDELEG